MLKPGLNHVKSRIRDAWKGWVLKQGLNYVKSRSGKQGWVLKQGLNHAKSRIRDAWKRWVLKQGLNCVKSRIREAVAQARAESRQRPKTYSWTAAFVLRASFAVSKAGVGA